MENPFPQDKSPRDLILFLVLVAAMGGLFWAVHKDAQDNQHHWGTLEQAQARFLYRSYMFMKYLDSGAAPSKTDNINSLLAEAGKAWERALQWQPKDRHLRFASVISLQAAGRQANSLSIVIPGHPGTNPKLIREYALQTLVIAPRPGKRLLEIPGVKEFIEQSPVRRLWLATIYQRQGRAEAAAEQWQLGYQESAPYVIAAAAIYFLWGFLGLGGLAALIALKGKSFPRLEGENAQLSLGLAVEVLLIWLVGQVILSPGFQALNQVFPEGEALFALLLHIVAAIGAIGWLHLRGFSLLRLGWQVSPLRKYLGLALGVFVLSLVGTGLAVVLQRIFQQEAREPAVLLLSEVRSLPLRIAVLLTACGLVPVAEEVLFRGILYRGLRTQWGPWAAALLSSALFAAGHLDVIAALPIFIFSLGLCWSMERSKSLVPAIIAHGLFNLFPTLMLNVMTF